MMRQMELVDRVRAYDPDADEDLLNRAYVFGLQAHGDQRRANGDPYFSHPVEVAGILTGLKLDEASIAAGLLHDTLEDTAATERQLDQLFGPDITRLVSGVTKLSRLELQNDQSRQAENFRKLILAMSQDIRVLLIKLADRLHNMRTLHFIETEARRVRIARETVEIYAPLAERIGLYDMKNELEDLAFRQLQPEAYDSIQARLSYLRQSDDQIIGRILAGIRQLLDKAQIAAQVSGREKSPYSIWRKMSRKAISFEQLSDIMAFRVLVDETATCYQVLGHIHGAFRVIPERFKDFISTPKPNGYRSLHTTVLWPEGQRIEVQIRTHQMHEIAERGVAAHWAYKQGARRADIDTDGRQYRWLRDVLEIVENAGHPDEFLDYTKLELFADQVFCFTPKGDLIALPRNATPIDFAYAVHSEVGNACVGARVNGRMVPLSTALQNGDQVDILTSKNQTPAAHWLEIAVTGKAKAHIRRFIRQSQRGEHLKLGRDMLARVFRQEGYDLTEKVLVPTLTRLEKDSVEDVLVAIGDGTLGAREVFHAAFPSHRATPPEAEPETPALRERKRGAPTRTRRPPLPIKGLIPGMAVHYARCCHPIPGDRIVGIITTGKGVTIHTIDCDTLASFSDTPERWLDVAWHDEADSTGHVGRLRVIFSNERGGLATVSTTIAKNGGNIVNLAIRSRSVDFWDMAIDIEVSDLKHFNNVVGALRALKAVSAVERDRGR